MCLTVAVPLKDLSENVKRKIQTLLININERTRNPAVLELAIARTRDKTAKYVIYHKLRPFILSVPPVVVLDSRQAITGTQTSSAPVPIQTSYSEPVSISAVNTTVAGSGHSFSQPANQVASSSLNRATSVDTLSSWSQMPDDDDDDDVSVTESESIDVVSVSSFDSLGSQTSTKTLNSSELEVSKYQSISAARVEIVSTMSKDALITVDSIVNELQQVLLEIQQHVKHSVYKSCLDKCPLSLQFIKARRQNK